jgi:DMSO/TMAO reductase YedYZ molybdopterin-dependent catalytic subunit
VSGYVSRGFHGKREAERENARVPPGQYIVRDFPVLSAGPTPHTPPAEWTFAVVDGAPQPTTWTWEEFRALPSEEIRTDIHCVTKWTKLDTNWEGVSVDTLLDGIDHDATHVLAFSDGD